MDSSESPAVETGQLRRRRALGSDATYRVLEVAGDHVEVEAIDVPGLEPGHRLRLLEDAVSAMDLLVTEPRTRRASPPAELPRVGPKPV
jgi:hypothetical protein